jgi:leucyl aminopeptidase
LGAYRPVRRGLSHSGQAAGAGDQSGQAEFPDPAGAAGAAGSSGDASRADRLDHPGHLGHLGRLGRLGPAGGADQAGPAGDLVLIGAHQRQAVDRAVVAAGATALARDLANWPSNQKTPAALAARLAEQAAARESITATVWGPDELAANGFAATLAVGAGAWQGPAADPALAPRLLVASHSPAKAKGAPHIVIVGKGITFDSGGLDLKPAGAMATMKTDMAGAAVAVATALAAADLGLAARVTAVAPLAQNSFGAASYRPGDVIEIGVGEGKTAVEVGDTDAEGRLVLADALSHAAARLKPDYLIDVATLTGAAKIALGPNIGAVFSRDRVLAERIEQAGRLSGERWWRLPLADDYREALTTPNAEISSVGKAEWGAGAITAALFLERFAGRAAWAHLDIAGPARAGGGETWTPPGATGFAVRTLIALVERLA